MLHGVADLDADTELDSHGLADSRASNGTVRDANLGVFLMGSVKIPYKPKLVGPDGQDVKMVKNPMLDYPGNVKCWCGAKKLAKNCCKPKMSKEIPIGDAYLGAMYMKHVKEQMGAPYEVQA